MNKNQSLTSGYVMILISAICFASYGVWSRIMGDEFGVFFQGWVRSLIVLAMLVPFMLATKSFRKISRQERPWLIFCMAFTVFTQVPLYYAFNHAGIGVSTLIFYSLFVTTSYSVGSLFLGEKLTIYKIAAAILALVGLTMVFGVSLAKFSLIGLAAAALNGIASGGEVSISKKVTHSYPPLMVTFWSWVCILVTHLPLSLLAGEHQYMPALDTNWLAMLAYSITGMLGFLLVIEGFKYVDASIGSLIGLLEIVFSVTFGIIFFHEHLTISILIGSAIIIFAAMLPDLANIIRHIKTSTPVEPVREI